MLRRQSTIRVQKMFTRPDRCQQKMLSLDLYRQPLLMLLPDGKNEYRTFTGAMLSILTIMVVLTYASFKFNAMIMREEFNLRSMDLASDFLETERFDESHGFIVAAGVIAYQTLSTSSYQNWRDSRIEIPPEIGAFNFYFKVFDPINGVQWKQIETKWCEPEDFDVEDYPNPRSRFYKTLRTVGDVRDFGPHLRCPVDTEDFMIYGSYETSVAQNFQAVFELCDEDKNKKNPETA